MRFLRSFKTLVVCIAAIGASSLSQVNAQEQVEVTDAELNKIASAFQGIQKVNMEAQQQVIKKVEESGFDANRFNELYQASASPEKTANASDEEKERFGKVMNEIQQMQAGFTEKIEEIISNEGMSIERYQTIAMALQSDTELQGRLRTMLAEQPQ
ncbi:DUF4168 domain-containing protein [Flagellimonas lutimaris]|jgi:Glu-tRNA(Gln) amidotransferase subunit E-like FAD-binding protein|uniref:DUF4168 domain-containing protein n=1 Tax=Flagellimonas lutimaris TaxID=475082 RepID=A0A3A1N5I9_9FLAO|nr:DUF4168 domain-containing protein [Allomuricauda lutimaris]RIV32895.1 DUF4168 domain-containing protein [Allomuricauda lutimaris]|tara:strand:+ start:930 stop:1397 length:468 start_codon:yes stop_codon:yes gene_type:complete